MADRADLQARALALLREAPYSHPDWHSSEFRWQQNFEAGAVGTYLPIWTVEDEDLPYWSGLNESDATEKAMKQQPFLLNFPEFLNGSWEDTATVQDRDGSTTGPSMEWTEMLAVRLSRWLNPQG